jgi:hypothetical protein
VQVNTTIVFINAKYLLDFFFNIRQSYVTKELQKRLAGVTQGTICRSGLPHGVGKSFAMHHFLVALVFVAMVSSPALIASVHKTRNEEDR